MDYLTENFTASRLAPKRNLRLPVTISYQSKEKFTPPKICGGALYKVKPGISVNAYCESDLTLRCLNDSEKFVKGVFGIGSEGVLIESKAGRIFRLSVPDLRMQEEFDLGILHSCRAVYLDGFHIVMFREERSRSYPLKVGRKSLGESKFDWCFAPDKSLSSFSVSDDKKLVVVTDSSGGVAALDIESGAELWKRSLEELGVLTQSELSQGTEISAVRDNPHLFGSTIILGFMSRYLIGIDINTGDLKWKRMTNSSISYTTVDTQGRQYFLAAYDGPPTLMIVDGETGDCINELELDLQPEVKEKFTSSVYSDVTVTHFWGVSGKGLLYAINLETGEMDWYYDLQGNVSQNPFIICNNRLYISTLTEQFIFEGQGGYIPD